MGAQYKFVKGQGDEPHEKKLEEAYKDGYEVKLMTFDPSHIGIESNEQVVILMEKIGKLPH